MIPLNRPAAKILSGVFLLVLMTSVWSACSIPTYLYAYNSGTTPVRIEFTALAYDTSKTYEFPTGRYNPDQRVKYQDYEKFGNSVIVQRSGDTFEFEVQPGQITFLSAGHNYHISYSQGAIYGSGKERVSLLQDERLRLDGIVFSENAKRFVYIVDLVETLRKGEDDGG
jgi:hypothetical protein